MRVLITAGPTYEPIDPVRFIGNRSSGQMGAALARAARSAGHEVTLIVGPVTAAMPTDVRRLDIFSSDDLSEAVLREFGSHDLLLMAAAVADFRPRSTRGGKIERAAAMTLELEPTEDILTAAGRIKRPDQRTVGFSLVARTELDRSREKLVRKNLDLIVHNPLETMSSSTIESVLLYPDGQTEELPTRDKSDFATILLDRAAALFQKKS